MSTRKADLSFELSGNLVSVGIHTPDAKFFVSEYLTLEDWQWLGKHTFVVDIRVAPRLIAAAHGYGLRTQSGGCRGAN